MAAAAETVTTSMLLILGLYVLADVAAVAVGLLIFFKGRAHVRKKYGKK